MAALTAFNLPDIKDSDLNSAKERRKILEYLYQLTEQLKFTLSNLDEDNLSESMNQTIQGAYTAASSASKQVQDISGNVSSVKQFADSLTLSVNNSANSSSIALMANGVQIASQEIVMSGMVTFESLSTPGQTVINGSNIKTGTISANLIDVDNLEVKYLDGASGTFDELSAVGGDVYFGPDYIDINGIEIGWLDDFEDLSIIPRFGYGGYGNIGVGDYYWDQVKANRFADASSLRYKTDIKDLTDSDVGSVDDIRLVTYKLKSKPDGQRYVGIIAEELENTNPIFVGYDKEGKPDSIDYSRLAVLAIREIQKLRARVKYLEEITA